MGRFIKWVEQNELENSTQPNPVQAVPQNGNNVEDLRLRSMLQLRLEQLLAEFEGMKIPKQKAVSLLGIIIGQMQQSFGLSKTHVKQAMKYPQQNF